MTSSLRRDTSQYDASSGMHQYGQCSRGHLALLLAQVATALVVSDSDRCWAVGLAGDLDNVCWCSWSCQLGSVDTASEMCSPENGFARVTLNSPLGGGAIIRGIVDRLTRGPSALSSV